MVFGSVRNEQSQKLARVTSRAVAASSARRAALLRGREPTRAWRAFLFRTLGIFSQAYGTKTVTRPYPAGTLGARDKVAVYPERKQPNGLGPLDNKGDRGKLWLRMNPNMATRATNRTQQATNSSFCGRCHARGHRFGGGGFRPRPLLGNLRPWGQIWVNTAWNVGRQPERSGG